MKTKKAISIVLCMALLCIGITGCGGDSEADESADNTQPLKIAMDLKYPPFTGTDDEGNPEGMEVDMAYALGEFLNREVEIINTDFQMLITALDSGEVDLVLCDMTVTEERKEKVDFSDPYRYGRTLALINNDYMKANDINDEMTEDEFFSLQGTKYVGLAGTISVTVPREHGYEVEEITEVASGIKEVSDGTSDVLIGENTIIGCQAAYPETTSIYWGIQEYSSSAMAVRKGNTELLAQINEFIASMYEEGGFYVEAGDKYDKAIGEYLANDSYGLDFIVNPPKLEEEND